MGNIEGNLWTNRYVARMLVVNGAAATEWAMDQALRSEACSAVLGWANPRDPQSLRRLQLAAESSCSLAVLYRPLHILVGTNFSGINVFKNDLAEVIGLTIS